MDFLHDVTVNIYYALCLVHVWHSVGHQAIFVLINIFTLLTQGFVSTLLVLTLSMLELGQCPSIASMSLQSYCADEKDGRIGLSL